jgi:hypothetical protein
MRRFADDYRFRNFWVVNSWRVGPSSFWGVEINETHVWFLVVNADRVAVYYVNIYGIYRGGNGCGRREKENDNREHAEPRASYRIGQLAGITELCICLTERESD